MDIVGYLRNKYPDESVFIFKKDNLIKQHRSIKTNIPNVTIAYAVKANPSEKILSTLVQQRVTTFDCASENEISSVLKINPKAKILFNHPIKSKTEISKSLTMGVRHFTVQNLDEVQKITKIAKNQNIQTSNIEIAIRFKTNNKKSINLSKKFGCKIKEAKEIMQLINGQFKKIGLSFHLGSQNLNPKKYQHAFKLIRKHFLNQKIDFINVGGGLPVIFDSPISSYIEYCNEINKYFEFSNEIILEIGRALSATSSDLYIPILHVDRKNKSIYINDGIFTSFSDFKIHNWKYKLNSSSQNQKKSKFRVYGRTCDSGDELGLHLLSNTITENDYIIVYNAGAYMHSQSTNFNGFCKNKIIDSP